MAGDKVFRGNKQQVQKTDLRARLDYLEAMQRGQCENREKSKDYIGGSEPHQKFCLFSR